MRVLVIDDDEDFRKLALLWFRSYGIEADGAANGAKGLALQRARPAAVIVTDVFMPEMEGIETIHDLRREFPEAKIIAMSGRDPRMKFDVFHVARELGAARPSRNRSSSRNSSPPYASSPSCARCATDAFLDG